MEKEHENKIKREIGEAIRLERERNNFTQANLAEAAGLHYNFVGQIERGEKSLSIISFYKICGALGIGMSDLLQQIKF